MTTTVYGNLPVPRFKDGIISADAQSTVLGVRYPLYDKDNSAKGIFNKTAGLELLKSTVRQFIRTERGERVMLPNFGLSLKKFLFEPMTEDMKHAISYEITHGLANYVPQAVVFSLDILSGDDITGLGLPGIKISLLIAERDSTDRTRLELNL